MRSKTNAPVSDVCIAREALVAVLVIVTLAPGIAFPCGSVTVPLMPDVPVWPHTATAQSSMQSRAAEVTKVNANDRFIDCSFRAPMNRKRDRQAEYAKGNAKRCKLTFPETPSKTRKDLGQPSPPLKPI